MLNMNNLKKSKMMTNFIQGDIWKTKIQKFYRDQVVIPFNLYFDDFEPDNTLGYRPKNVIQLPQHMLIFLHCLENLHIF